MTTDLERWKRRLQEARRHFDDVLREQTGPVVKVRKTHIETTIFGLQALADEVRDLLRDDQRRTVQCPICRMKGGHDQRCEHGRTGAGPQT